MKTLVLPEGGETLLGPTAIGRLLGWSRSTVRRAIREGRIGPAERTGDAMGTLGIRYRHLEPLVRGRDDGG